MKVILQLRDCSELKVVSAKYKDVQTKGHSFLVANKESQGIGSFVGNHLVFWEEGKYIDTRGEWRIVNPTSLYVKTSVFTHPIFGYEVRLGYSGGTMIASFPTKEAAEEYSEMYNNEIDRRAVVKGTSCV